MQACEPVDRNAMTDAEFRAEFRAWLEAYYPEEWRRPIVFRLQDDEERAWLRLMHDHGWRLPSWPREHGGMGLSISKQLIFHEELEKFGAARYLDSGGVLLGPVLIRYGTPAQKQKYLQEIARGDVLWAQGYSEPNSGSDLASLRTTAVRDGDHYIINGTKIWTTMVMFSRRMFLLARTSSTGRKQEGISFFLLDTDTPGITITPIENLAGDVEFGQVFFDNVRIPAENLVHHEGEGWTVAKSLLGDERITSGSPSLARHAFDIFERVVRGIGLEGDAGIADLHAELLCDLEDLTALYEMICDAAIRGTMSREEPSMLKVLATETFQRIAAATLQISGEHAGVWGETTIAGQVEDLRRVYMIARPSSIYGGANEVQRDIIARALLGKAA